MCKKKPAISGSSKKKRCCTLTSGCARAFLILLGLAVLAVGVLGVAKFPPLLSAYLTQDYALIAFLGGVALLVAAFMHFVFDRRGSAAVGVANRLSTDPRAQAALLELQKMATVGAHVVEALEFKGELERIVELKLMVGPIVARVEPVAEEYGARVAGWPAEGGDTCALKKAGAQVGDRVFSLGERTLWKDLCVEVQRELKVAKITPLYVVRAIPEAELQERREAAKAAKRAGAKGVDLGATRAVVVGAKGKDAGPVRKAANLLKVMLRLDLPGEVSGMKMEGGAAKEDAVKPVLYVPPY